MAEQDEREARFQEFIKGSRPERDVSPSARLRDAFAALLARGQDQATPIEAFWPSQAAALREPPQPDPTLTRPREMGDSATTDLPMRQIQPADPTLDFPQAMPGLRHGDNPWRSTAPAPAPFHGKGEYVLPKDEKKNKKKGKR